MPPSPPPPGASSAPRLLPLAGLTAAVVLVAAAAASCGARSSLFESDEGSPSTSSTEGTGGDGGEGGAGGLGGGTTTTTITTTTTTTPTEPLCTSDADCDDGLECTLDFCDVFGCYWYAEHTFCDDGIFCTVDECHPAIGCTNMHTDDICEDGIACTIDVCDPDLDACVVEPCDLECINPLFCDGIERCDAQIGCISGPPACSFGLGCDQSTCAEGDDTCTHTLPPGCVAPDVHLLVTDDSGNLYDVAPYASGPPVLIAPTTGRVHLDIAVLGGRWFSIGADLAELLPGTNQVIATFPDVGGNSLGAGPDGMLYGAAQLVYRIDPNTGAWAFIGALPPGHTSSGDLTFIGDLMYVATDGMCGGSLVEFNLVTGTSQVLGGNGLGCVFGLAAMGDQLVLYTCDGRIGTFDPATRDVRMITTTSIPVYGIDLLSGP